jgi:pimeloyl-ACP methyl ester carboxylesterase
VRSTTGATVRVNEYDIFWAPIPGWTGSLPGVLFCHGAGGLAPQQWRDRSTAGHLALANALGKNYSCGAGDMGGTSTWGNNTSITALGQLQTWLQGTKNATAGKIALVGVSMGACAALNYARANPTLVACLVVVIPILDLNDVVTNNRGGFASAVNTAYGGTYSDTTDGPTHSPVKYAASFTIPTLIYYAPDDAIATVGPVNTFTAACASSTKVSVGNTGHSEASVSAVPPADVVAYIRNYL